MEVSINSSNQVIINGVWYGSILYHHSIGRECDIWFIDAFLVVDLDKDLDKTSVTSIISNKVRQALRKTYVLNEKSKSFEYSWATYLDNVLRIFGHKVEHIKCKLDENNYNALKVQLHNTLI